MSGYRGTPRTGCKGSGEGTVGRESWQGKAERMVTGMVGGNGGWRGMAGGDDSIF